MDSIWQSLPLRELCEEVQYGYTASSSTEPVGPRYLRITDIVPDQLDWGTVPYCEIEDEKLPKYKLHAGDIVVARTGATVGYAKYVSDPPTSVFASYLVRLKVNDSHDKRYVGEVVESNFYKEFILAHAGGAAQANANAQVLTSFPIPVPPLPTQQKIAAVLAAYDGLIENNLRRIEILEEMAQALYREWFVEFRFPGHEDKELVESELGPIPEAWAIETLAEMADLNPRHSLDRSSEVRFIPMGSLKEGSMVIEGIESRERPTGSKFQNGDTLLARITPSLENGKTGFVQCLHDGEIACGSTEFIVLRSKSLTPEFLYLLARTDDFRSVAIKSMVGASGRQRVQEASVSGYVLTRPPHPLLERFTTHVRPAFQLVQSLVNQNSNLRATRDLLLPKLVSGEIDVSDLDIDTEWLVA